MKAALMKQSIFAKKAADNIHRLIKVMSLMVRLHGEPQERFVFWHRRVDRRKRKHALSNHLFCKSKNHAVVPDEHRHRRRFRTKQCRSSLSESLPQVTNIPPKALADFGIRFDDL